MTQENAASDLLGTAQTSSMKKPSSSKLTVWIAEEPSNPSKKQSRASISSRRSIVSHGGLRSSFMQARTSGVHPSTDFEALVVNMGKMGEVQHFPPRSTDFKALTDYFMGFWKAPHAAAALKHVDRLETKRTIRKLQKVHGFWQPPPEVTEALKNNPTAATSSLPDTEDCRNLKFVLKILGCTLSENQPYKEFLKAKTLRQKRHWLYKYQGPRHKTIPNYAEPICPTRLKRLYNFFPDRFTDDCGIMHFNDQMISYDEVKNVFYIGKDLDEG